jgi:hypothetical protein
LAVNIKLDKLLEDHGYSSEEVLAAEDQSDKKLERKQRQEQNKAKRKNSRKKKR